MATNSHTAGLVPAVNDIVAGLVIVFVYAARFGTIYESVRPSFWYAPLYLTTDFLVPLAAVAWLLAGPCYQLYKA